MATHRILTRSALATALTLAALNASAFEVTREFSGLWLDRDILGHGINVDIINGAQGKTAAVVWYTFAADGRPMWLAGSAPVNGKQIDVVVSTLSATVQPGPFGSPGGGQFKAFGTLHFDFSSCNSATVAYDPIDPALANGTLNLQRGTQLYASQCTGGISDDKPAAASDVQIEQFLGAVGNVGPGKARARFAQRSDRSEFSIELEDLAAGQYRLVVGGEDRGRIDVVSVTGGTEGETEFRSPVEPGKILLDFDPRGQIVEVRNGNAALFAATFAAQGNAGSGSGNGGGTSNAPSTGDAYYLMKLEPAGNDGPELEAELEQRADRVEFSVEIEDAAIGEYALRIGGSDRGTVNVVAVSGGTKGEVEFRNPVEAGKQPLDFDPRGQTVEALRGGIVQFSGRFPSDPTGPANDDDDDSGDDNGGSDDDSGDDNGGSDDDNGGSNDDNGDDHGSGTSADVSLLVSLNSTGADSDANGEASFEQLGGEREFEVDIEDLADGIYTLNVGGSERGAITVSDERGELKFSSPARADRELLDFDPRGQTIEIWRNGTRFLSGQLP